MQATRPDFFNSLPTFVKDEQATKQGATDEEKFLYGLSLHKGWKVLSEYIDNVLKDLDNLNKEAIAKGLPLEEIGRNTIVITMVKDVITRIVNKVEDSREACEGSDGRTK